MRTLLFTFIWGFSSTFALSLHPNLYYKKETDVKKRSSNIPDIAYTFDTAFAKEFVADFDFDQPANYAFQELSDAGIYLTHLGENNKALNVFQWLHEQHSEEYNITSNLGVVHELNGNLDSAEHYLLKAFTQSPHDPPKTEWVQLKIIAAKRSIQQDPNWLLHHHVLNLNWDTSFYQNNSTQSYTKQQRDSLQLLRYTNYKNQLDTLWSIGNVMKTHIPYVSSPNLLVANIMKELGYHFAINLSIKDAFVAYKIALHYDPKNQLNITEALTRLMPHFRKYEFDESIFEAKFHPANNSLSRQLPAKENPPEDYFDSFSLLTLQASIALLLLVAFFSYTIFNQRKK